MNKGATNLPRRLKGLNPVFHKKTKAEDEAAASQALLRQARKSGKLNLSNRNLSSVPAEVLTLGDVHSEDSTNVALDGAGADAKWWELEPLSSLDLSANCISALPPNINQLDTLTVLLLHDNSLARVPPELGHLFKLTKLDLAQNKLTELPMELTALKELRWLSLANNQLTSVPLCIFDLVMLQHLDISRNELVTLESGMGFLVRLTHLDLSHNKLTCIPPDISNCKALLSLNLSHNAITSDGLPPLGDLHAAQVMDLTCNKLSLLPSLNGCSALKEIHLAENQIKILIPEDQEQEVTVEELSTLSHLQVIVLRDNQIEKLPREMSCMHNLIRLDLTNNNLTELPATLALLPHLRQLLVEGNSLRSIRSDAIRGGTLRLLKHLKQTLPLTEEDQKLVAALPCQDLDSWPDRFSMRSSKTLTVAGRGLCSVPDSVFDEALEVPCNSVDLSHNKLTQVPQRIWCLAETLTDLNLSHNQVSALPEDLGTCLQLTYLCLQTNLLTSLPVSLGQCQRLREVNIACNRFVEIPPCLYEITGLEIVIARDNKMTNLNVDSLRRLKQLATLDLSNNSIASVPPQLGLITSIRNLGLDGNGLKVPRPALLAKGTDAVLAWLRDRIPV